MIFLKVLEKVIHGWHLSTNYIPFKYSNHLWISMPLPQNRLLPGEILGIREFYTTIPSHKSHVVVCLTGALRASTRATHSEHSSVLGNSSKWCRQDTQGDHQGPNLPPTWKIPPLRVVNLGVYQFISHLYWDVQPLLRGGFLTMILQGSTTSGSHWDFQTPETSASRGSRIDPSLPWAPGFSKKLLGSILLRFLGSKWVFPKMVGFPNWPMGFPTQNDHFGVEIGGYHHLRKHPNILWVLKYSENFIPYNLRFACSLVRQKLTTTKWWRDVSHGIESVKHHQLSHEKKLYYFPLHYTGCLIGSP